MPRYIDADRLLADLPKLCHSINEGNNCKSCPLFDTDDYMCKVEDWIHSQPNKQEELDGTHTHMTFIEVPNLVCCKDCRYSRYDEEHDWYLCYANFCSIQEGDFYCAAGERKEKEDEKI